MRKKDNYEVDHMNAHVCVDGRIGYSYPCRECEAKESKKKRKFDRGEMAESGLRRQS